MHLGQTLRGEPFFIEGHYLEKVNVITGVKGAGKSYLSKVVLLELINAGAPCIVFDLNKEYIHLPKHDVDPHTGAVRTKGIIHLKAGENLKLGVRQFGLSPLVTMLTRFGLPDVSAMYFENRMARLLQEAWHIAALVDRDPLSRTRGSCSRMHWAWKFNDFPFPRIRGK